MQSKNILRTFFLVIFIFIFSESSETHFDLVPSKIRAKINFSSNYGNLCRKFSKNFDFKIDYISEIKNRKNQKIVFSQFSEHFAYFGTKGQKKKVILKSECRGEAGEARGVGDLTHPPPLPFPSLKWPNFFHRYISYKVVCLRSCSQIKMGAL